MHVSGKVFLGLLLVAWGVGLYYVVGVNKYRTAWVEKIGKEEADLEKIEKEIVDEQKARAEAEGKLDLALIGWGQMWNGVIAQVPDANGVIQVRAEDGNKAPMILVPNQVVWVFSPGADANSSTCVGSFKVAAAPQGLYSLAPAFRLRTADPLARPDLAEPLTLVNQAINPRPRTFDAVEEWNVGNGRLVRIRTAIPPQQSARFLQKEVDLLLADERVMLQGVDYVKQVALLAESKKQVQLRTEEITGAAALADKNLPPEFKVGLLKALQDEDETRNKSLLAVDDLRHRVKRTTEKFTEIRERNSQLEQSLPQPAADATARADR